MENKTVKIMAYQLCNNYRDIIEFANSINLQKEDYIDIKLDDNYFYLIYYKTALV